MKRPLERRAILAYFKTKTCRLQSTIIIKWVLSGRDDDQDATVYVGGLDEKVDEELLWELFLQVRCYQSL